MRFLFVSHSRPYPPTNGGNQRTALLLRALAEIGEVDLLLMHGRRPPDSDELEVLQGCYNVIACMPLPVRSDRPAWRWLRGLPGPLARWMAHHVGRDAVHYREHERVSSVFRQALAAREYDLVVGRYLRPTALSGALGCAPLVLDVDDLDYDPLRTRLADPSTPTWRRPLIAHHLRQLERLVPTLLTECEHLWVSNRADQDELQELRAGLLPNIPFVPPGAPPIQPHSPVQGSARLLIVASFLQDRNVAGVDYFVRNVWPRVRSEFPASELRLVGSNLTNRLRDRWARVPGVDPVGFVADLSSEYAACAFTVAPLFYGGGSNIKVIESLAYGRTCVVTPFVRRGFDGVLDHEDSLLVGGDVASLADGCLLLLRHPSLRQSMADRGTDLVQSHYSYGRFRDTVHTSVRRVVAQFPEGVRARHALSPPLRDLSDAGGSRSASAQPLDQPHHTVSSLPPSSECVPDHMKVRVCGLQRSGNHVLISWIMAQYAGRPVCFLNNVRHGLSDPYETRTQVELEGIPPALDVETLRNMRKDMLILSYEDDLGKMDLSRSLLDSVYGVDTSKLSDAFGLASDNFVDVLVIRDPFNLLASRMKSMDRLTGTKDLSRVASDWKAMAVRCLDVQSCPEDGVEVVTYNEFVSDQGFRTRLSRRLMGTFTDASLHKMSAYGGGSSFDRAAEYHPLTLDTVLTNWKKALSLQRYSRLGYYTRRMFARPAISMRTSDRWRAFTNDADFARTFQDRELIELSEALFGVIPDTREWVASA